MEVKNLIGGLLAGVALGLAIGVLLAPASGQGSGMKLIKGSQKFTDKIKKGVKDHASSLPERYGAGVDQVSQEGNDAIHDLLEDAKV